MEIPSKWAVMEVGYGEGKKFLYHTMEHDGPNFFATEKEAQEWAQDHCRFNQKAMVVVVKIERMVKAKPVEFDNIAA